ncbi:hypothetical protein [Parabacteroides goldsteinii]|nr:hypothetical protein [Parabacteroides goldsteinii]
MDTAAVGRRSYRCDCRGVSASRKKEYNDRSEASAGRQNGC